MDTERLHCARCKTETNHRSVARHERRSAKDDPFQWFEQYDIMQCAGCDHIAFLKETGNEDDCFEDPETGYVHRNLTQYPAPNSSREPMERFQFLPPRIATAYLETIQAINGNLPILAGMGLRTLIEALCKDQGAEGGDLRKRIDSLRDKGVLSQMQTTALHSHRFLGNIAAHEVVAAQRSKLLAALEIAETVIKFLYLIKHIDAQITTGRKSS